MDDEVVYAMKSRPSFFLSASRDKGSMMGNYRKADYTSGSRKYKNGLSQSKGQSQ